MPPKKDVFTKASMLEYVFKKSTNESISEPKVTEKMSKFKWKNSTKTSNPITPWTPPYKTNTKSGNDSKDNSLDLDKEIYNKIELNDITANSKLKTKAIVVNHSSDLFHGMDIDTTEEEIFKQFTNTQKQTKTSPKSDTKCKCKMSIEPVKHSPCKNIMLDDSLTDFLKTVTKDPVLEKIDNKKPLNETDLSKCNTMYIEVLEKVFTAFDRIPTNIKEKLLGYDRMIYSKVKILRTKFKTALKAKPKNRRSTLLEAKSQPEFSIYDDTKTSTPILTQNKAKRSLFDEDFSLNDSNPNSSIETDTNKSKGKFVYKKPRTTLDNDKSSITTHTQSNTMERFKNALGNLKPITPEAPVKVSKIENSSADLQAPLTDKNSILKFNTKPCNEVSPIVNDSPQVNDTNDHIDLVDIDDTEFINLSDDVVNLSDTMKGYEEIVSNNSIPINDDGFPEYRPEDFEDDLEECLAQEPKVIDLLEQSVLTQVPQHDGMGNFQAGTKNDGITEKSLIHSGI